MTGAVTLDILGTFAHVTVSNPHKLNAMSRAMWAQLRAVFARLQASPLLRAVVVQGEGGNFCAGGDISEYPSFRFAESTLREFHETDVWGGLQAMLDCDLPIVAQIEGNCMGAGLEIASCCDIRIACTSARFGAPISRLGFPMAPREAALVMRAVGELTAREMLLSAAVLGADEIEQRGFLNQVVALADLPAAVDAVCARIGGLSPTAIRLNKKSFRVLIGAGYEKAAIDSVASDLLKDVYHYADSEEHREGVNAFVQKREPQF